MSSRKSFIIYKDSLSVLDELDDEQAGRLLRAIRAHHDGSAYEMDAITKIVFSSFKAQFDRDAEKYENICKSRALAGSNGGKQKVANASKSKQGIANLADSDSDSDSESVSESVSNELREAATHPVPTKKPRVVFIEPTQQEIGDHMRQCGYSTKDSGNESIKFVSYYQSNGWMVGRSKMKDWKAAVVGWMSRGGFLKSVEQQSSKPRAFGE